MEKIYKEKVIELFIVGGSILGVLLGILTDYWSSREYRKNFRINLMNMK